MKKNRMLRMASALMVLTLLTTCIIGGTFAKYTTTGSASDTARVAKWGVVITTSGSLYSDAYAKANTPAETTDNLPAAWTTDKNTLNNGISVAAATEDENIVAPGTKSYGNGLSFGISGKPEVAVEVKTNITAEDIYLKAGTYGVLVPATVNDDASLKKVMGTGANAVDVYAATEAGGTTTYTKVDASSAYNANASYYVLTDKVTVADAYYPVKYTLDGSTTDANKTAIKVAEDLATAIKKGASPDAGSTDYKATYTDISENFNANTDLGTAGPQFGNEKLQWEWAYEAGDNEDAKKVTNAKDTILGDLIAARDATVDYKVVSVDDTATGAVTVLTFGTDNDYTVKGKDSAVVANLRTKFNIELNVTQID